MRKRRRHSTSSIEGLRLAIDCLPVATREAMLEGVRASERIIVGAYVDEHGGVCPMLAAHRNGGRTDFLSFAKSWDRFAGARGGKRQASKRELAILVGQLEASLAGATGMELDEAIREHRALVSAGRRMRGRARREAEPEGEIRVRDLRRRPRIFRGDNVAHGTGRRVARPVPSRG